MSIFGQIFNPLGLLQDTIEHEIGAPALRRIEEANARRPLMPLVGLGLAAAGLVFIVAITISAGAHADNFAGAPGSLLDAVQFRPWFRAGDLLEQVDGLLIVARTKVGDGLVHRLSGSSGGQTEMGERDEEKSALQFPPLSRRWISRLVSASSTSNSSRSLS